MSGDLMKLLLQACRETPDWYHVSRQHWVMNPDWYRRVRAEMVTEEQERARAAAHANAWIAVDAEAPYQCPAKCAAGPFSTMKGLTGHVVAMADPAYREPDANDTLFGYPLEVREDGGDPTLSATPDCPGRELSL